MRRRQGGVALSTAPRGSGLRWSRLPVTDLEKGAQARDGSSCGTSGARTSEAWEAGSEDSQKETSVRPATLALGRVACKARHSARVAGVMSSPAQAVGMRSPAAVQPEHTPRCAWYLMGHSKGK